MHRWVLNFLPPGRVVGTRPVDGGGGIAVDFTRVTQEEDPATAARRADGRTENIISRTTACLFESFSRRSERALWNCTVSGTGAKNNAGRQAVLIAGRYSKSKVTLTHVDKERVNIGDGLVYLIRLN